LRTQKISGSTTTDYIYSGDLLMSQSDGTDTLSFIYSPDGQAIGVNRNGYCYYYLRNVQGDVIALYNSAGNISARYVYDSWGKLVSVTNASGVAITDPSHIANLNPIRYRGYYYDTETGLYYLQSRYYNPEMGRFINADGVVAGVGNVQGYNLFQYCMNNPINMSDESGHWPKWIKTAVKIAAAVAVVAVVTAAVVVTAGGAAVALGASAAVVSGVMTGAAIGGVTAGAVSIGAQMIKNNGNINEVSLKKVAKDTLVGSTTGALSGGASGAASAASTATQLLVHKGFQVAANVAISDSAYILQSAKDGSFSGHGLAIATGSGIISGVTFDAPAGRAFAISLGLGIAGSYDDLISIFGENLTTQPQR